MQNCTWGETSGVECVQDCTKGGYKRIRNKSGSDCIGAVVTQLHEARVRLIIVLSMRIFIPESFNAGVRERNLNGHLSFKKRLNVHLVDHIWGRWSGATRAPENRSRGGLQAQVNKQEIIILLVLFCYCVLHPVKDKNN